MQNAKCEFKNAKSRRERRRRGEGQLARWTMGGVKGVNPGTAAGDRLAVRIRRADRNVRAPMNRAPIIVFGEVHFSRRGEMISRQMA